MRRRGIAVASVIGAVALALSSSGSAVAAQGVLIVDGTAYTDPSGCYNSAIWPLRVDNRTDEAALVFNSPNCQGEVLGMVPPGGRHIFEDGASVYIR